MFGKPSCLLWYHFQQNQRGPKGPPNEDPSKSGLRVSFVVFFSSPYSHLCKYRKYFEELFLKYVSAPSQICILTFAPSLCMDTVAVFTPDAKTSKIVLGNYFQSKYRYMLRVYSHPSEHGKRLLANYLYIGFVPGGNLEATSCCQWRGFSKLSTSWRSIVSSGRWAPGPMASARKLAWAVPCASAKRRVTSGQPVCATQSHWEKKGGFVKGWFWRMFRFPKNLLRLFFGDNLQRLK